MAAGELVNPGGSFWFSRRWLWNVVRDNQWLCVLLLLGFFLRVANLLWGVPISPYATFYHADEHKAWGSTAAFPEGYMASESYLYGTTLQYAIGTLLLPVKAVMVWGLGANEQYVLVVVIFSRLVHVLMGTASIALVSGLGERLRNSTCGLIAAAFVCVAPTLALTSCYATLDVPMGFLVLCGIFAGLRATETGKARDWIFWGGICGALIGTKITGGLFLIVSVGWSLVVLKGKSEKRSSSRQASPSHAFNLNSVLILLASTVGIFALTCPQILLDIPEYLEFMRRQKSDWYDKSPRNPLMIAQVWWTATSTAVGPIVTILALFGSLPWRQSRSALYWVLVSLIAINYLFWQGYLLPRLIAPVAPLVCLFAGYFLSSGIDSTKIWQRSISLFILFASIGLSLRDTGYGIWQRWYDPRTEAARYIDHHIPENATIGIAVDHNDPWQHHQWRYPQINFHRLKETHFLNRPEWIVVTSLECDVMRSALKSEYLGPGYQWDEKQRDRWYLGKPPSPAVFQFFEDLLADKSYRQAAVFETFNQPQTEVSVPSVFVYQRIDRE